MDQTPNLTQNVDTLFTNLENFTQNEGLIGKPVTHGDKTFIPVVSVTLGYGSGSTAAKQNQQTSSFTSTQSTNGSATNNSGGALGLGAKLNTEAVILIDKENVSMMSVSGSTNATQIMDKIPQILTTMNQSKSQTQGQQ